MTAEQWGTLVPAIAGFLVALAAWLRAETARKTAVDAKAKIDSQAMPHGERQDP